MKYSLDLLKRAAAIIDSRRRNALKIFEENREIAYKAIPELSEIDDQLSSSGIAISREVLSKKGDFKNIFLQIKERNNALTQRKKILLKENGFSEDFLDIKYRCKKCNDTGYVDAMPCSCLAQVAEEISKNSSSQLCPEDPDPFVSFDLKYYPEKLSDLPCKKIMESIFENCKQYAEEFSLSSPNLLIFGGTGIGKTHISLAIAKKVQQIGFDVVYMSAPDLFTSLENERFKDQTPQENMQKILNCNLLVIDDLGAEFTTSFTTSALYNIINSRILSGYPTIITANLSPSEISERYSDRIASRLIGCYEHLHFLGNDIRILKKKGL
ncbi:MAG: AAA family ATPase [Ruminococcaceae bacterium]|nr:AAA family ATPase [Oscillospiraceae bacterium]